MKARALFVAAVVALALPCLAWNPLSVRQSGAPRWDAGSFPIVWNPDGGGLGQLSNSAAAALVADEFAEWQAVPTSSIRYAQGTQIIDPNTGSPTDVTSANYADVLNASNGQNPIIFDNDRDIFDLLGQPSSVLGFAGMSWNGSGTTTKGYAVLQGDCFDGDSGDTCGEVTEVKLRGTLVHEFGHFSGLGHSAINKGFVGTGIPGCPPATTEQVETMSPTVTSDAQNLEHDDKMGISHLYPTAGFLSSFSTIQGTLVSRDGSTGFNGANLVLRPDSTDCDERYDLAQAMQSGVAPGDFGGQGSYAFHGLTPDTDYTVLATSITESGSYPIGGGSPPQLDAPDDYYNGIDEAHFNPPDDPTQVGTVSSGSAGGTVSGIDVRLNNSGKPGAIDGTGPEALTVNKFEGSLEAESLVLDDGGINNVYGFNGTTQLAWINRFTPSPEQLPFELQRIDIHFWHPSAPVGRDIRLLVYLDPAGSGSPAASTLEHTQDATIMSLGEFNEYILSSPVLVESGDLYVGAYDLVADADTTFIATYDIDTIAGRSYRQTNGTSPGSYALEASRTWGIRATGSTVLPAGTVLLGWGDSCNAGTVGGGDYAVYEGSIASLGGALDHASIACGTAGEQSLVVPAGPADRFWLVSPLLADKEGSLGTGSSGSDRLPATTCKPVDPETCP